MGGLRISVIGGGNWGTAVARIVAINASRYPDFDPNVLLWVHQADIYEGRPVAAMINEDRINHKYLPGFPIPLNVMATNSKQEVMQHAQLLVFVLPHQFASSFFQDISSHWIAPDVKAVSLIKGLHVDQTGTPKVFSQVISDCLGGASCCALSGANVASDIAREQFAEATLGFVDENEACMWQKLFHRPSFRICALPDPFGVQVCGAVKNVIALAAGFCDGLALGSNTKAATIRLGIEEMRKFALMFFDGVLEETLLESAGVADIVTTCYGGRNVKCAAEFVRRGGGSPALWEKIESDLLNGQKLQGHLTCLEVYHVLKANNVEPEFPLFVATYNIAHEQAPASTLLAAFTSDEAPRVRREDECSRPCPRTAWYSKCRVNGPISGPK